jgi:hypothetical protein
VWEGLYFRDGSKVEMQCRHGGMQQAEICRNDDHDDAGGEAQRVGGRGKGGRGRRRLEMLYMNMSEDMLEATGDAAMYACRESARA